MKYFLDTEFLEGPQTKKFFGIPVGKTKPTIDLISIGIVGEDNREYYAISKDFNIEEAWNRYDRAPQTMYEKQHDYPGRKIYWIRENVLLPIFKELLDRFNTESEKSLEKDMHMKGSYIGCIPNPKFRLKLLKFLINYYGKTNKQIASEVRDFVMETGIDYGTGPHQYTPVEFYTYYGDYDWVVFCWLFGKMIDLPTGFPMYSKDLKQMLDEKTLTLPKELFRDLECSTCTHNVLEYLESTGEAFELDFRLKSLKSKHSKFPKQEKEHNALDDAKWNKALYEFIKRL